MTPKMFWSWLGSLIFVVTVLWNLMYGIPEPVLIGLIGLWSMCFAFTVFSTNEPRKEHWRQLQEHQNKRTEQLTKTSWSITLKTEDGPRVVHKPDWMDDETCRAMKHEDWLWLEEQGAVEIEPIPVDGIPPHENDIGPSFPWPDVQEARANIDRAGRQKFCKHIDKTEITTLSDRHKRWLCGYCNKIIES